MASRVRFEHRSAGAISTILLLLGLTPGAPAEDVHIRLMTAILLVIDTFCEMKFASSITLFFLQSPPPK